MVQPMATWEAVARARLEAVLNSGELQNYMRMPLAVSLFSSAEHVRANRTGRVWRRTCGRAVPPTQRAAGSKKPRRKRTRK